MITVQENHFWREGERIGYIMEDHIYDHTGKRIGYFENDHVYDYRGVKIGYLRENEIRSLPDDRLIARIDENRQHVSGGTLSDLARAAVRLLLGD